MRKLTLLLGAALIMGTTAFAGDGAKGSCCKGKSEHCSKDKKECGKGKTAASNDAKKAPTKEAKSNTVKKS